MLRFFKTHFLSLLPGMARGRMRAPACSHGNREEKGLGSVDPHLYLCCFLLQGLPGLLSGLVTTKYKTLWSETLLELRPLCCSGEFEFYKNRSDPIIISLSPECLHLASGFINDIFSKQKRRVSQQCVWFRNGELTLVSSLQPSVSAGFPGVVLRETANFGVSLACQVLVQAPQF